MKKYQEKFECTIRCFHEKNDSLLTHSEKKKKEKMLNKVIEKKTNYLLDFTFIYGLAFALRL